MFPPPCNFFLVKIESVEDENENESHFNNEEGNIVSSNKETYTNAGSSHEENVTNPTVSHYFYFDKLSYYRHYKKTLSLNIPTIISEEQLSPRNKNRLSEELDPRNAV
jgi:hypothetical protein